VKSLPANRNVVGIWKLGLFNNRDDNQNSVEFYSCSLTFCYNLTKVRKSDNIELLRWENSGWVRVAKSIVTDDFKIPAENLSCLDGEWYNAGTFALIRKSKGLTVAIR
jgi:hypothetical protein